MKQNQLAAATGISGSGISQIESGTRQPSDIAVRLIAKALKASPAQIYLMAMEWTDVPKSKSHDRAIFIKLKDLMIEIVKP